MVTKFKFLKIHSSSMNGSYTKAEIEEIKRFFNPPIPKEVIEKIVELANSFFKWLGADISIDESSIRFVRYSEKEDKKIAPSGIVARTLDGKLMIYFNRDHLKLTKPEDIKEHEHIFEHEFYHVWVYDQYGKDIDRDGYSEGLAYLLSTHRLLKERNKPYSLLEELANEISNDIIKQMRSQQKDNISYINLTKIKKEAMKKAIELINERGECLLVDPKYKEAIIRFLSRSIELSLPNSRKHLARCMAEKAIDLLYEKYKKRRDSGDTNLEDALRDALINYLEYRRRVIEGCERSKND